MLPKNPEEFHQKIALVFHALLALPITAFIYLFLELRHKGLQPALNSPLYIDLVNYIWPVLGVLLVVMGYLRFRKDLKKTAHKKPLPEKLNAYGKKLSVFFYYLAGSAVIWVAGLYLTTSVVFIVGYVFLLFFMSFQRPTPSKYVKDLILKGEERDIILHKEDFKPTDV